MILHGFLPTFRSNPRWTPSIRRGCCRRTPRRHGRVTPGTVNASVAGECFAPESRRLADDAVPPESALGRGALLDLLPYHAAAWLPLGSGVRSCDDARRARTSCILCPVYIGRIYIV